MSELYNIVAGFYNLYSARFQRLSKNCIFYYFVKFIFLAWMLPTGFLDKHKIYLYNFYHYIEDFYIKITVFKNVIRPKSHVNV